MSATGTAAVTGASGFIGRALVERLRLEQPVRVLVRRRDALSDAWEARGVTVVVGDLDAGPALARLVSGAAAVYHCAAYMGKADPWNSHRVNVAGTTRVARAALAAEVGRFVYVSSISVFGATREPYDTITERVRPRGVHRLNAYAMTKYLGELSVRRLGHDGGLPFAIVRPTNVYGPGSGPWFEQFARLLRRVPVALGDVAIDVVYVDDVVDAIVRAARAPAAEGRVFHAGHEMVPMRRVAQEVGRVIGRRARTLPRAVDRVLRTLIDRGYLLATGTHMSLSLRRSVRYPHHRATDLLGWEPRVGLEEGFARIAQWYATRGRVPPRVSSGEPVNRASERTA